MQTGPSFSSGMDLALVLSRNKPMRIWRQKAASKVSFASALLDVLFWVVPVAPACTEGNVTSDDYEFIAACCVALACFNFSVLLFLSAK